MEFLVHGDAEALAAVVREQPGTLRHLMGRLWDPDPALRRRALDALGELAAAHPDRGREALRRMMWALTDEAATNGVFGIPLLAAVARHAPEVAAPFVGPVASLLWDAGLRPTIAETLAEVREAAPALIADVADVVRHQLGAGTPDETWLLTRILGPQPETEATMVRETQRQRIERCRQEVAEHPERATAHHNLGLALTVSGRVKEAEEAYLKAVELDPTLVQAWVNLGGIRMMRWEFKGVLEANQRAVELQPELVEAHFNMGQAYLYLNRPEDLLRCNQRVLELDRDHAQAHYFAAVAQLALDNLGAAERHLGRAMELGHQPTQDFLKALEKAQRGKVRHVQPNVIEISGSQEPENQEEA